MRLYMILTPVAGKVPAYITKTIYNVQLAHHPEWVYSRVPAAFKAPLKQLTQNVQDMTTLHFIPHGDTTRYVMQNHSDGVFVYVDDTTPLDECDNYIDYNTGSELSSSSSSSLDRYETDDDLLPYEPHPRRRTLE